MGNGCISSPIHPRREGGSARPPYYGNFEGVYELIAEGVRDR